MRTYVITNQKQIFYLTEKEHIKTLILRVDKVMEQITYLTDLSRYEIFFNLDYKTTLPKLKRLKIST